MKEQRFEKRDVHNDGQGERWADVPSLDREASTEERGHRPVERYSSQFVRLSDSVERILRLAVLASLVLLVASQLLLGVPSVRKWAVKTERLEGVPYERIEPTDPTGQIRETVH